MLRSAWQSCRPSRRSFRPLRGAQDYRCDYVESLRVGKPIKITWPSLWVQVTIQS
jgi:hypothetical protein